MDGWMVGWMEGSMHGWMDGCMAGALSAGGRSACWAAQSALFSPGSSFPFLVLNIKHRLLAHSPVPALVCGVTRPAAPRLLHHASCMAPPAGDDGGELVGGRRAPSALWLVPQRSLRRHLLCLLHSPHAGAPRPMPIQMCTSTHDDMLAPGANDDAT